MRHAREEKNARAIDTSSLTHPLCTLFRYVHEFTVAPIKKTWHRIRPAKMAFIDGVEGDNTIMHMSNSLPDSA